MPRQILNKIIAANKPQQMPLSTGTAAPDGCPALSADPARKCNLIQLVRPIETKCLDESSQQFGLD